MSNHWPLPPEISAAFDGFEPSVREQLLACRDAIFAVAAGQADVGPLTETLKWGQPSYLTEKSGSGSTIRLAVTKSGDAALFVHCATDLILQFRSHYPDQFSYEGKRALLLPHMDDGASPELAHCIALALTYKLRKRHAHAL